MATLSTVDLSNARKGGYECREALKEVAKIEACGLECGELKERALHLMKFFEAVLNQYSPGASSPAS